MKNRRGREVGNEVDIEKREKRNSNKKGKVFLYGRRKESVKKEGKRRSRIRTEKRRKKGK